MLIHIKVAGRVQGVGFRAFVRHTADTYGISGWVRNRRDGCVEIMADGEPADIELFLADCHRGPCFARVTDVMPVITPDAPLAPIAYGTFQTLGTV